MAVPRGKSAVELLIVGGCCAFLFFYGLGSFGLVGADEPRYAQIAREMLARHDWVTPVLNGTAWLEKPVLYYWGAMLSYSVFGVSDWAARLPTAVMTTLMVLATYGFMRRFRPGSQLDAALILASLAAVIGFGRAASTDMPLTSMFSIGMLAWYGWHETRKKPYLVAFYVFIALATLAKGPVAPFLAALVIVVFSGLRREWNLIVETLWVPGVLLFVAVALPWFVMVQRANPQFVHEFIFEHNLARYGSNIFRHKQPFWYFIPVLLLSLLPWMVFAIAALARALSECKSSNFALFFGLWADLPVIFFSFSQSKLPGYILPALPAFALLTAEYLRQRTEDADEPPLWLVGLHSLINSLLLGSSLLTVFFVLKLKPSPAALTIAVVVGIICFAGMMAGVYGQGLRMLRVATVLPLLVAMTFVIRFASPAIDTKSSARPIAQEIARLVAIPSMEIAVFGVPRDVEYGVNFYENHRISSYDRGEIPAVEHVLVAREGSGDALKLLLGARVSRIGDFPARRIEIYRVASK